MFPIVFGETLNVTTVPAIYQSNLSFRAFLISMFALYLKDLSLITFETCPSLSPRPYPPGLRGRPRAPQRRRWPSRCRRPFPQAPRRPAQVTTARLRLQARRGEGGGGVGGGGQIGWGYKLGGGINWMGIYTGWGYILDGDIYIYIHIYNIYIYI